MSTETKAVVLKDVELAWAFLNKKQELKDRYSCDLINLSPENVAILEGLGVVVKDKAPKGRYLECVSTYPIAAVDINNNVITDNVGPESRANVLIRPYTVTHGMTKKPMTRGSIVKMKVTVLNKLEAPDPFADEQALEEELL